jgi:long-chain fatty acid transport protein
MMKRTLVTLCAALLIGALAVSPALATNGMNMIGYNVRSSGMGGADVAIDTDCSGSACNPATLGRQRERSAAIGFSALMPQLNTSNDNFGIDVDGEDQVFPLPYLAYAQRLSPTSPWTLGVDFFAQGGMGVDFEGYPTPGGPGSFDSQVRYGRLTGAAAYRVNDQFSLGLALMGGYADMKFSLFPEFASGLDAEDMSSFGLAARIGAHYKVNDMVSLGIQYTSETSMDMDGGNVDINFGAMGGVQNYDAEMKDFGWPQEVELGIALQAMPQLLLAFDAKWIGWSSTMDVVTLVGTNPDIPAPPSVEVPFNMNWDDQWVFAIGGEYVVNAQNSIRLGYNYGKSPVPDMNLSPLFPAIVEHHVTVGYGYTATKWAFDFAYEHAFENTQTNNNPNPMENPFGPGTSVSHSQNTLHFAVTYFY